MLIAKIDNGHVLEVVDARGVFGAYADVTDKTLSDNGFVRVNLFRPHDQLTQKLVSCAPVLEDGWVYTVEVQNKTDDEITADKASAMANIRARRNQLLQETDGTQAVDNPNPKKTEWASYRQQLRDLPSGIIALNIDPRVFADWPHNPDWVDTKLGV